MCNENNKLEITLESLKTESSKFSMTTDMFRRVNGEGLAWDQMFCICDDWVDRSSAVLTSAIKSRYGKVSDQSGLAHAQWLNSISVIWALV